MRSGPLLIELKREDRASDPFAFSTAYERYSLRTADGAYREISVPWAELLPELAQVRAPGADPALIQRVGERLRRILEPGDWASVEAEILSGKGRVILDFRPAAAELLALPWELLTLRSSGQRLGELPGVLLRLSWPEAASAPRAAAPEGGRLVFAWSAAGGAVPHREQLAAVEAACRAGGVAFSAERDVLPEVSIARLLSTLREEPAVMLHLLAHGGRAGSTRGLILQGDQGPTVIDPGALAAALAPFAPRLQAVVLSACESGGVGELGNALGSLALALHRAGVRAVISSRNPLAARASVGMVGALYSRLLGEPASLETAFLAARQSLQDAGGAGAGLQLFARPGDGDDTRPFAFRPYRGLEVFDAAHRRFFFGRDAEAAEIVGKLDALPPGERVVLVAGASGTGKSSLVRAEVLPRLLEREGAPPVRVMRAADGAGKIPGDDPMLLLVDQGEEAFSRLDAAGREALFRGLLRQLRGSPGSRLLITVRVDFLGRFGEITLEDGRRLDQVFYEDRHRVLIAQLSREAMREAIAGPAGRAGVPIEAGLVEQLIDEVAGEPGALPLLEFALDEMWRRRDPVEGLTLAGYRALGGGLGGLLEREADRLLAALSPAEQEEARRVFVQLVSLAPGQRADTRARRSLRELRVDLEDPAFDRVIQTFTDARLLVTADHGEPSVEIAHEELIRRWSRLRAWVDEDRQKWIEIGHIRAWDHLLRGAQLDRAREARARYGEDLGPGALALIARSEAAVREEEEREARRQKELLRAKEAAEAAAASARNRALGALVFGALALGVAGVAWKLRQQATVAEAVARSESRRAYNAALLAAARQLPDDPGSAAIFLSEIQMAGAGPGSLSGFTELAWRLLIDERLPSVVIQSEAGGQLVSFTLSDDGRRVIAVADDGTATVRALPGGRPIGPGLDHGAQLEGGWLVGEDRAITWSAIGETVRLWSLPGGREIGPPVHHEAELLPSMLRGGVWVVRETPTTARVRRLSDGAEAGPPITWGVELFRLALSPDGRRLATVTEGGEFTVFDVASGAPVGPVLRLGCTAGELDFGSDSEHVLVACADQSVLVSASGGVLAVAEGMGNPGWQTQMAPMQGRFIGYEDANQANEWRGEIRAMAGGALIGQPLRLPSSDAFVFADLQVTPDGRGVMGHFAGENGFVQFWSLQDGLPIGGPFAASAAGNVDEFLWALPLDDHRALVARRVYGLALLDAQTGADQPLPPPQPMRWMPAPVPPEPMGTAAIVALPDGGFLRIPQSDGEADLFDAQGERVGGLRLPGAWGSRGPERSADGALLTLDDNGLRIWSPEALRPRSARPSAGGDALALSADGGTAIVYDEQRGISAWRLPDLVEIPQLSADSLSALSGKFTGELAWSSPEDADLWRMARAGLEAVAGACRPMLSADGRTAVCDTGGRWEIWSLNDRAIATRIQPDGLPVGGAIGPDGRRFAGQVCSPDGATCAGVLWSLPDGVERLRLDEPVGTLIGLGDWARIHHESGKTRLLSLRGDDTLVEVNDERVDVFPGEWLLATLRWPSRVTLRERGSGALRYDHLDVPSQIMTIDSAGGAGFLIQSFDETLRLLRPDGNLEAPMRHPSLISSLRSPDNRLLLTWAGTPDFRIWDLDRSTLLTGSYRVAPIANRRTEDRPPMLFTPDGSALVGVWSGFLRVFDLDPGRLVQALDDAVQGCVSPQMRQQFLSENAEDARQNYLRCMKEEFGG